MFTPDSTWNEIETKRPTIAVVTIGSTEQHGTHLPLCTDTVLAERFARLVAEELGAYLTPTIPVGQSDMWLEFPGSLSVSGETMKSIITDLVDSLVRTGFTRILFVSVHGANVVVYQGFPESLQAKYSGVRILTVGWPFWVRENWAAVWKQALAEAGIKEIHHADEAETSMMLAWRPDLVGSHPTDCPVPANPYPPGKTMRQMYPSGSMGYGSKASKAKGEILWRALLRGAMADLKTQLSL